MKKITILFCDDEIEYLKYAIHNVMKENFINEVDYAFATDQNFSYQKDYDAYFLDIEMPSKPGFVIAKTIYEKNKDSIFIFMTSHEHYKMNGYGYHPFDFIAKNDLAKEIKRVIMELLKKFEAKQAFVHIKSQGIKIALADLLYVMTEDNYRHIITTKKDILLRSNDEDLQELLNVKDMLFIRRGVWVNMQHIAKFKNDTMEMTDKHIFKVSRKLKKQCHEQYLLFE